MHSSFLTLTINTGSSSIKVGVFDTKGILLTNLRIENIGQSRAVLVNVNNKTEVDANDHRSAIAVIMSHLFDHYPKEDFIAVGHRVVHGGDRFAESTIISDTVINDLKKLAVFDPLHLSVQILAIEYARQFLPSATHIACFDTAFYRDMPKRAQLLPIPRRYYEKGIRRYGFHGLSYSYLIDQLRQLEGDAVANGRVIFAHLGSGASLTATYEGKPVDTTMGLTPLSGLMMSTRSGDLDPGLFSVLHAIDGMNADEFNDMVSKGSGLLGVSDISADMAMLIEQYPSDARASEAVELFCYEIQKAIGSLVAVLGGLDALVFSGGIGENAPFIRDKIGKAVAHFGVAIDPIANEAGKDRLSKDDDRIVRIIKTNEESVIAKEVRRLAIKEV